MSLYHYLNPSTATPGLKHTNQPTQYHLSYESHFRLPAIRNRRLQLLRHVQHEKVQQLDRYGTAPVAFLLNRGIAQLIRQLVCATAQATHS